MANDPKHLHIVSFNVPYPPDYGGVIDVFYRIRALHSIGVKIHLHCFQYGRPRSAELQKYCENVFYYKRNRGILSNFSTLPYVVKSRMSNQLLRNLLSIKAPILFEGEHTSGFMGRKQLSNHPKWVRIHNIEHQYYQKLGEETKNYLFKAYYRLESIKLRKYEDRLRAADGLLSISTRETDHFNKLNKNTHWLPAFHMEIEERGSPDMTDKFLFHGDLEVSFNLQIAKELADIFKGRDERLTIAGRINSSDLSSLKTQYDWVDWVANADQEEMKSILYSHSVHLIFAKHKQGVKLKLIHSLLSGAFVIANKEAVHGSGLKEHITLVALPDLEDILNSKAAFNSKKKELIREQLAKHYNNRKNAELLKGLIFNP